MNSGYSAALSILWISDFNSGSKVARYIDLRENEQIVVNLNFAKMAERSKAKNAKRSFAYKKYLILISDAKLRFAQQILS